MALQFNVFFRLFLFGIHFKKTSRHFYKWLKRKIPYLAIIEGEQRLILDIWRIDHYIAKLQAEVVVRGQDLAASSSKPNSKLSLCRTITDGSATTISSLKIEELECSICLEFIVDGNSLTGEATP